MSIRRLPFGARPSSAHALSTRPSVQWTPDFSAGAAGLELEAILNRFHLGYRTTAVVSGGLKLLARPEDVLCRRSAWSAVALEAADTAYLWKRTRRWQSMLEPGVSAIDSIVGIAAVTLGSRSMHLQPQIDGTAWTNRMLTVRVAAVPLSDRRGRELLAGVGVQLLPHLLWQPPGSRRRIIAHSWSPLTSAFVQAQVISSRMRRQARIIDARAIRWARDELDAALAAEEAAFLAEVLGPAPAVLAEIASLLTTDRAAAARRAAEEECRLRWWLSNGSATAIDRDERAAQMEVVDEGVRRLSRRIQGGVRLVSSIADVVEISRRTHRHPGAAFAARGAIAGRAVVGAALASGALARLTDDETARRMVSAADLAVIAATGVHQIAEGHDPSVIGWIERLVYEVSATSGALHGDAPDTGRRSHLVAVHAAMAAIRAATAAAEPRPVRQRLAAALNEAVVVQSTARQLRAVFEASLDQARRLTAASLDLDGHWTELDDVRVANRAFVHDGMAQALAAVARLDPDDSSGDRALRRWLDHERVRVEVKLGRLGDDHGGDLHAVVDELREEFGERGVYLLAETSELPSWIADVGSAVGEIVREALNNVVKHAGGDSAWCGVLLQDDGTVLVRICDFATDYPVFRPGSGTGTATMIALARSIGADIEWFQTATGGTEVRLLLHPRVRDPSNG